MKIEQCSFSGNKIYPGNGQIYVRGDNKTFRFVSSKSASLFHQRKNPRKILWTVLCRRMHKKGITEEEKKKRTRRTMKFQRAIVGANLDVLKERRTQRPEVRAAQRSEAIKAAKDKKAAKETEKKLAKAKTQATQAQKNITKVSKQGARGANVKVAAKSR
ncbi:60S ribosomal protein L24-A [Neolecta irregularis DAH-3]|uniref:60S ribosomal protein L24-A n=1 Tax=Neolecta irregularis (strain DAH-3) TaxID=1198029 RepID=A0A1U7LUU9_NEOID|nr:60S ribosomal protein L24-A [Neolecta irregularis DAH-3]|eukprot:OLL26455.1 60S ribosomal protein L24-A [Neolecta irregularis DAH-3]